MCRYMYVHVFMYVYVYVCACVCVCTCACVCACACACVSVSVSVSVSVYASLCACVPTCVCTCTHTRNTPRTRAGMREHARPRCSPERGGAELAGRRQMRRERGWLAAQEREGLRHIAQQQSCAPWPHAPTPRRRSNRYPVRERMQRAGGQRTSGRPRR